MINWSGPDFQGQNGNVKLWNLKLTFKSMHLPESTLILEKKETKNPETYLIGNISN